jgi:hypothetical protein
MRLVTRRGPAFVVTCNGVRVLGGPDWCHGAPPARGLLECTSSEAAWFGEAPRWSPMEAPDPALGASGPVVVIRRRESAVVTMQKSMAPSATPQARCSADNDSTTQRNPKG